MTSKLDLSHHGYWFFTTNASWTFPVILGFSNRSFLWFHAVCLDWKSIKCVFPSCRIWNIEMYDFLILWCRGLVLEILGVEKEQIPSGYSYWNLEQQYNVILHSFQSSVLSFKANTVLVKFLNPHYFFYWVESLSFSNFLMSTIWFNCHLLLWGWSWIYLELQN